MTEPGRLARWRRAAADHRGGITVVVAIVLLAVALLALDRLTQEVRLADVRSALATLSPGRLVLALGFTALSYLALTFYDLLALRIIGRPLPWRTAALASFTSYTLSHNLGLALLTGGSARYRVYTSAGLNGPEVANVIGLAGATFWAGVIAIAGVALVGHDGPLQLPGIALDAWAAHLLGLAMLAGVAGVFAITRLVRTPLRLFGMTIPLPRAGQFAAQLLVAGIDLSCASAALFVLMPDAAPTLLPTFVLAYALGIIATVLTHVPGGIGVFEAVVLSVLPGDRATLLAALIAYRVVYYLLPLAVAIVVLAIHEGRRQRGLARFLTGLENTVSAIAPLILSTAVFGGGALLLLSGALPSIRSRMGDLSGILPLPFIEASHLAASLVGTMLLLLAPGLYRRLDGANLWARLLLLAGALFSLAKGIDYEEAIICLGIAALLQWTRGAFYRRTMLTQGSFSAGWFAAVATVLGATIWVGFFAFRHVPYSDDLWWRSTLNGDAPRFLRAAVASAAAVVAVASWRLLAHGAVPAASAPPDPARIAAALAHAERTDAMLALTGDKRFLWSESGDAFLMYAVSGATWVVMGDPVGPRALWPDLLWRMRETTDRMQARLFLYEVSAAVLDLAIGMGLAIVKIGEEALVDLDAFDLETPRLRGLRRNARSLERKGLSFHIVPAAELPAVIDELAEVSAEWMAAKGQREKRFSLGRFDRDYLARFDTAVVRLDGRIVAFANLWLTPNVQEASVDLMRHRTEAPSGTMDYLFVTLILWAKGRGYRRFSLGMAPLSGIEDRRLAPAWARLANFTFRKGERLYGFKGLRAYKEKFAPDWVPRYVAGPSGVGMVLGFGDVARLIDGRERFGRARPARPGNGARAASAEAVAARTGTSPRRPWPVVAGLLVSLAAAGCVPALVGGPRYRIFAPPHASTGTVALFVSGDSGLAYGMGRRIAGTLATSGIAVLGLSSPAAFGATRTRAQVDAALGEGIRRALAIPGAQRLVLIGQSFGADMLAVAAPDLPPDLRARVSALILIVPGRGAFFRADPLGLSYGGKPDAYPAAGVRGIDWTPVTCIQGEREDDSLCSDLADSAVTRIVLPGGHFLGHDDGRVVAAILDRLKTAS